MQQQNFTRNYPLINKQINKIIVDIKPSAIFIPYPDRHIDHRTIFGYAIVNTRPKGKYFLNNVII